MVYFKENYIFKAPEGVQHFTGEGGGGNVNIELVNFQGGVRTSGSAHAYDRSTCFFSKANPERQVFSCNGQFFIARATSDIRYMILDISSGSTLYSI